MNDLRKELAPITAEAWKEIEDEATRTLKTCLAARKLVDFSGPHGWDFSAVNLGRAEKLDEAPSEHVTARLREVQPLCELRATFELSRDELDSVSRGAADPDLDPLVAAAKRLALAENRIVFYGYDSADVTGICPASSHKKISLPGDSAAMPRVVSEGVESLREAGVSGPYRLALSPPAYSNLAKTVEGGYPVIRHVERLLDGPIIWAPGLDGALVLSLRGGDFELIVGRDISIGYLDHTAERVRLYFEESLTFRVLTPEAAVAAE